MAFQLTERQRRWLDALLVLATVAAAFVVLGFIGGLLSYFGDILLVFFLAWLLAFILSPVVNVVDRMIPFLPRVVAVVIVYLALLGILTVAILLAANALAASTRDFISGIPALRDQLPSVLQPWQERLDSIGFGQVDLVYQATTFLDNLSRYATQLVGPIQQLAVASLGALGNLLLVLVLSLYMVVDSERILSFLFRIVPPARQEEARLLETSIAASFGGFLRGQAILGITYAAVAFLANVAGQLDYTAVTTAASGTLMAIPFFGPFVSWAPPVLVAILTRPDQVPLVLASMIVGWLLVMNVLQPRLMEEAVGIHPIVVLGSVLIGSRIAGIPGAIFGIPVAAVLSAFFFHFLGRTRESGPVAVRAARRLEAREGRPVRVPREPNPAVDTDVDEAAGRQQAHPLPADGPNEA